VNNVDGKVYVGKHQTLDLNDDYLGSGKHLRNAIKKYGIENFSKEILFIFDNEDEMNAKESELVTEEFCSLDTNSNLCSGGKGGWSYINRSRTSEEQSKLGKLGGKTKRIPSLATRYKISKTMKHHHKEGVVKCISEFSHLAHTSEAREKRKETYNKINFQQGKNNSQYGISRIWINDGNKRKRILPNQKIPEGWILGFKLKFD
jgi:hypothetical protein